ncbi:MAG: FAD-dependent oxidoreductase [Candidatus Njordarchaeales archaeon]
MKFSQCTPETKHPLTGKKVAIIGAGPAGLTIAGGLICMGHEVTVYDAMPEPGGLLIFGIPDFRMPKDKIIQGIKELEEVGVLFVCKTRVGKDIEFEQLLQQYDAIVIATGAWKEVELDIPGRELEGIYPVLDFLVKLSLYKKGYLEEEEVPKIGKKVVVIGGGNSAIDGARTVKRLGANVTIVYRRTKEYMPAHKTEVEAAEKEGVNFVFLASPIRFVGDETGRVKAVECVRMRLGELDSSGRPRPEPIPGSEFQIPCDTVLLAIGEIPTPPFEDPNKYDIAVDSRNRIIVDEKGRTTRKKVFAAGDVVTGPKDIASAIKMGKIVAKAVDEYLETGEWPKEIQNIPCSGLKE